MERIPSIIQKMQERYTEGASASELLFLLEDMRRELNRAIAPVDHTKAPVSVWLPQGYVPPSSVDVKGSSDNSFAEKKPDINEKVVKQKISLPFMSVPRPPVVRVIETEGDDNVQEKIEETTGMTAEEVPIMEPIVSVQEEVINEVPVITVIDQEPVEQEVLSLWVDPVSLPHDEPEILQQLTESEDEPTVTVALEIKSSPEIKILPEIHKEEETETQVIFELDLPSWESEPGQQKWEPVKIPEGFLVGSGFKESLVAEKPRELHEILANRVLAKPQGNNSGDTRAGVMDKISGGKITDLKKGFSINDRFRFINSLFRGDEAMFDRAIKTINNFDILPEAQYWMQRELIIKLGWNDEDELVQHFHQLVMRRFM
jgi:hypothetical protein